MYWLKVTQKLQHSGLPSYHCAKPTTTIFKYKDFENTSHRLNSFISQTLRMSARKLLLHIIVWTIGMHNSYAIK